MKKLYILLYILLILALPVYSANILKTQVKVETTPANNSVRVEIEGGNSLSFKCNEDISIRQYFDRDITSQCGDEVQECTNNFDQLSAMFYEFGTIYNNTLKNQPTLEEAIICKKDLSDLEDEFVSLKNESEDSPNLRTQVNSLQSQLSSCNSERSSSSTCQIQLSNAESQKWTYALFGAIGGALLYYLIKRPPRSKLPGEYIPSM